MTFLFSKNKAEKEFFGASGIVRLFNLRRQNNYKKFLLFKYVHFRSPKAPIGKLSENKNAASYSC